MDTEKHAMMFSKILIANRGDQPRSDEVKSMGVRSTLGRLSRGDSYV